MLKILPLNKKVLMKVKLHNLEKKVNKQLRLLSQNPSHPGLNIELLIPKEYGIYSFRIDRKFRGLFIFRKEIDSVEILNITVHYK